MSEEVLQEIVARVAHVDRQQITAKAMLGRLLGGSLGRARLDAEVRAKLGVSSPAIYSAATYGELQEALGGGDSSGLGSVPLNDGERRDPLSRLPASGNEIPGDGIAVGIDIEMISALPTAIDYWEDEFYRRMFTSQEIAYALLQAQPRLSLAASWCAKEALRKAYAQLSQVDWARIQVVHDPEGKPSLELDGAPVAGVLSLSHTDEIAIAAFFACPRTIPLTDSVLPAPALAVIPERKRSRVTTAAAWLALFLAAASIAIQLLRR
jgi:phosphopantetheine--protein transferase-like protein